MKHAHTYRGMIGFLATLCLLVAGSAIADERKHVNPHSMEMDYSEYFKEGHEGKEGHHGEIRGHGKKKEHGDSHGHSKKSGHHGMHGDGHHHAFSLHALKKKLHLTTSQVDAIRPVEADYKKAVIRKKADVRIAEIDLGLLIDSPSPDRGKLKTIVESIGRMKGELMMARIDAFLNVKKELTAEQQEEFSKMVHGHMMGHAGAGHGGGHHGKKGHRSKSHHGTGHHDKGNHGKKGHGGMDHGHGMGH